MVALPPSAPVMIKPIVGYLRSTAANRAANDQRPSPVLPFLTLSRQAGAGAMSLGKRLIEHLNSALDSAERQWSLWDRELVEKVAADHHIAQELIDNLAHANRNWLEEFFMGASLADRKVPSEMKVFRFVASTIRALAQAGRVVLVGRGGVMITQDMPGGVHVRMVAPLEYRINNMMRVNDESREAARARIERLDQERAAFYKHYWPDQPLDPERFTLILNSSRLTEDQIVAMLASLLERVPQPTSAAVQAGSVGGII